MTIYLVIASAYGYEESDCQEVAAYTNELAAHAHAFAANEVAMGHQRELNIARQAWEANPEEDVTWNALEGVVDNYRNPYDEGAVIVENRQVSTYHVKPMKLYKTFAP